VRLDAEGVQLAPAFVETYTPPPINPAARIAGVLLSADTAAVGNPELVFFHVRPASVDRETPPRPPAKSNEPLVARAKISDWTGAESGLAQDCPLSVDRKMSDP
jgi:hypothetical protein